MNYYEISFDNTDGLVEFGSHTGSHRSLLQLIENLKARGCTYIEYDLVRKA